MQTADLMVDTAAYLAQQVGRARHVLYVPNPGNAGDAAIASATLQLLERMALGCDMGRISDIRPGACVLVGGGGNLVPYYSDVRNILLTCLSQGVDQCILLPHSVRGHEDLLAQLDERFSFMCRDLPSLAWVRRHAPRVHAVLARDLVLELDVAELERKTGTWTHRWALMHDRQWLKGWLRWKRALYRVKPDVQGTLTILRSDVESQQADRSQRRQDLMRYKGLGYISPSVDAVTMDLIRNFRKADRVVTDRLHVSLLAAMLDKPVCLLENSYGKLSAVWEAAFYAPKGTPGSEARNPRPET